MTISKFQGTAIGIHSLLSYKHNVTKWRITNGLESMFSKLANTQQHMICPHRLQTLFSRCPANRAAPLSSLNDPTSATGPHLQFPSMIKVL